MNLPKLDAPGKTGREGDEQEQQRKKVKLVEDNDTWEDIFPMEEDTIFEQLSNPTPPRHVPNQLLFCIRTGANCGPEGPIFHQPVRPTGEMVNLYYGTPIQLAHKYVPTSCTVNQHCFPPW